MMSLKKISLCFFVFIGSGYLVDGQGSHGSSRCSSVPTVSKKVDKVITECQDKIKVDLLEDVYALAKHSHGKDEWHLRRGKRDAYDDHQQKHHHQLQYQEFHEADDEHDDEDEDHHQHEHQHQQHHQKQHQHQQHQHHQKPHNDHDEADHDEHDFSHPTVISNEDKWIAGCLMHCVYKKNNAVDKYGWPTLDGLVELYTDGVHEHGYFMSVLRGVDSCLKGTSIKYNVQRHRQPERGETCEISFDIFDCISDKITEYCSDHHYAK